METKNIYYHGSSSKINKFDFKFVGGSNARDQYGSGFYFSKNKDLAVGYSLDNQNGFVHQVKIDIKNPLNPEHEQKISKKQIEKILKASPNILEGLENFNELKNTIKYEKFLNGNNLNKDVMIKEMLIINKPVLNEAIEAYYNDEKTNVLEFLNSISNDFFEGNIKEFNTAVKETLGYDSVSVDFDNNSFIIAWFPEQIDVINIEKSKKLKNGEVTLTKVKSNKEKELEI